MVDLLLVGLDFDLFMFDLEAQSVVNAHVLVRDPDQGKKSNEVSPPVEIKQLVAHDQQNSGRDVVPEAIFAGKQVKEFAANEGARLLAFPLTRLARFAENFLVRDRLCNTRDRNTQY
jgi:hypothetical protein